MSRLAAALLLLTGPTHGNGPTPIDTSALRAHDFATLTDAEARRLEGKPALFRVTLEPDSNLMAIHLARLRQPRSYCPFASG
jgi:hypothetical protein